MRKPKKIKLSRETLYNLETADLKQQWGGASTIGGCGSVAVVCFRTAVDC